MYRLFVAALIFACFAARAAPVREDAAAKRLYEKIGDLTRRDPAAALKVLDESIAESTNNWILFYFRGGVHHALNQPELAIRDYTQSIDLHAPGAEVYNQRAFEWLRLDQPEKALDDFDSIAELFPKERPRLWLRGLIEYELGHYEPAARQLVSGYSLSRNDVENSVWIMCCQARVEGLEKARQALLPVDSDPRIPMAQIWHMFKGEAAPESVLETAKAAPLPKSGELPPLFYAHFYIGLYNDLKGNRAAALASLQRAIEMPMPWSILVEVARIHRDHLLQQMKSDFHPVRAEAFQPRGGLGNFYSKLGTNQEVRVAFFGGSITAANGWRVETMKWLREAWPAVKFTEINGAIGGTGSDLGVFRFRHDVLEHKPDLIFLEFAVNDSGAEPISIWRAAEGILRQAWQADQSIDFCFVYTYAHNLQNDLASGLAPRAASAYELLASKYEIPSINVALPVAQQVAAKTLIPGPIATDGNPAPDTTATNIFSEDGVHPTPFGHHLYFEQIKSDLLAMKKMHKPAHFLRAPLQEDNWVNAKMIPVAASMSTGEWKELPKDDAVVRHFADRMPGLWAADSPRASLDITFRGPMLGLYDIMGPDAGKVVAVIDGVTNAPISRFDTFSSYHRLATCWVATNLSTNSTHHARIGLDAESPDKTSVIAREKSKPGFDPKRYEGTVLRVGAIMLLDAPDHE